MAKIKESQCCPKKKCCCCGEEGATGLQCVWMHLHAADLTVVFLSTVLANAAYMYSHTPAHTHTVHTFIPTPLFLLPEQERGNTRTHCTALLSFYDGQDPPKQIPSHARALLFASAKLTLASITTRQTACEQASWGR